MSLSRCSIWYFCYSIMRPAVIIAWLARRDLNRLAGVAKLASSGRGITDKLAVTLAALLGRI